MNLYPLRASLSETEIARYRWLGTQTADATIESLHEVEPGLSEYDLEALTAANLLRRGIHAFGLSLCGRRSHLQVQARSGTGCAAEEVWHAQSLLAQVGIGDLDYALRALR